MVWPDSRLTRKSEEIQRSDFDYPSLTQDAINLFGTLKDLNGLGLSACQVGDTRAFFVYRVGDREGAMFNPKIIADSGPMKHESQEGCLSFPGVYVKVQRFNHVTVQYQDEDGQSHEEELIGILGDCIQHEIDHLNGRTIISYLSKLKRDIVTRKMTKLQKRIDRVRKVSTNAARRAVRAPSSLEGTRVPNDGGRRDTGVHRVHLPSE